MRLRRGTSIEQLLERLAVLCAASAPFTLPQITVRRLGGFVACAPCSRDVRLHALADTCVQELDRFRAPSSAGEIAWRRAHGLKQRQEDYLLRWGYPYVFEEYRFHMTLTGTLDRSRAETVVAAARPAVAALPPLVCDAVCVFEQPLPDAPFRILARLPLALRLLARG